MAAVKNTALALRVAATIFGLVCLGHVWRILAGAEVQIAGRPFPLWVSAVAAVVSAVLTIWMWSVSRGE